MGGEEGQDSQGNSLIPTSFHPPPPKKKKPGTLDGLAIPYPVLSTLVSMARISRGEQGSMFKGNLLAFFPKGVSQLHLHACHVFSAFIVCGMCLISRASFCFFLTSPRQCEIRGQGPSSPAPASQIGLAAYLALGSLHLCWMWSIRQTTPFPRSLPQRYVSS